MKKFTALFLALCLMVLAFCGCSSKPQTGSEQESGTETSSGTGDLSLAEQAIAERKASGVYPKVSLAFFTWVGAPAGTERIQGLINDITKEKLGIEVELNIMDSSSFSQNVPLMCASGEKLDIFAVGGIGFMSAVNNGYLYDLNEDDLLETYGQGILGSMDNAYIKALSVNGAQYGIPPVKEMGMSAGYMCFGQQYLDAIGYDYNSKWSDASKEVIKISWDELDQIMADLHKEFPDKYVLSAPPMIMGATTVDPVCNDWHGVLMDPANSLELSDIWSSDLFKEFAERSYNYNNLGYISSDAVTNTVPMGQQVGAGTAMSMGASGKPGYAAQVSVECSMPMICFQLGGEIVRSSVPNTVCWGLNQNTEDPIAAMQLFDLLYTDSELSNLLCWGEEGKDYVVLDDGRINYPEGTDGKTSEWNHAVQWEMPNECISHVWYTNAPDVWERTIKFNEDCPKSKALGFTWDNNEYASQFTALQNVYQEYFRSISFGAVDPSVAIPEYIEKLKSVGLDEYIEAKRTALNAWAEENNIS